MKKIVVFVSVLIIFISFSTSCSIKKVEELTDRELIANEYGISSDNPYQYINLSKMNELLNQGTGILLLANSDDEGSKKAISMILTEAKKQEVKQINYYNPKMTAEKDKKKYQQLVDKIKKDLDNEELKIEIPSLYAIKDGKVINYARYFSTNEELSEEYLTKKRQKKIEQKYQDILNYIECTDC